MRLTQTLRFVSPEVPTPEQAAAIEQAVVDWLRSQGAEQNVETSTGSGSWWLQATYYIADNALGETIGAITLAITAYIWRRHRSKQLAGGAENEALPTELPTEEEVRDRIVPTARSENHDALLGNIQSIFGTPTIDHYLVLTARLPVDEHGTAQTFSAVCKPSVAPTMVAGSAKEVERAVRALTEE